VPSYIALFRGINVGKAKRIAMADLRKVVEGLGYADVKTLLNSGNLVFTARGKATDAASKIEKAVATKLGVSSRVTVLSATEVAAAVEENPLGDVATNPSHLLLLVPWDARAHAELKPLLKQNWRPEQLALGKRVAYIWCAENIVHSPLWAAVNKMLKDRGTSRNISTMKKLVAMSAAGDA